jgi:hypothetical protein
MATGCGTSKHRLISWLCGLQREVSEDGECQRKQGGGHHASANIATAGDYREGHIERNFHPFEFLVKFAQVPDEAINVYKYQVFTALLRN